MASPGLPETVTGLDGAAHRTHHETIHAHENDFDYDALAAAADGKIIKKVDGLWAAGDDLNSGASGFTDIGHRYVDYQNGVDTNNGLSPSTAMKTIQAAHDDLPSSGIPRGGTIWLAEGQHIVNGLSITKDGTRIIGAGIWSTELLMDQTGHNTDCVRIDDAESCYISDLQITDRSSRVTPVGEGRYGLYVDGGQESVFERLFFNGWADNYAGTQGFDDSPTAIFIEGVSSFGDWMQLNQIRIRDSNAGVKLSSGTNGWLNHVVSGGKTDGGALWIMRKDVAVGPSTSWRVRECQWLASDPNGFAVRVESNYSNHAGRVRFDNCHLEISTATGDGSGYFLDLTDIVMIGGHLGVANMSAGKKAIHVGSNAAGSVIGPYSEDGLSLPGDFQDDAGIDWWQPSDYSGNYAP